MKFFLDYQVVSLFLCSLISIMEIAEHLTHILSQNKSVIRFEVMLISDGLYYQYRKFCKYMHNRCGNEQIHWLI